MANISSGNTTITDQLMTMLLDTTQVSMNNISSNHTNTTQQIQTLDPGTMETFLTLDKMDSAEVKLLIPTIIYLVFISVFGMLGNSFVIHIYRTRYKLSNSQCFILCLSAIDLFSCCVAIPLEVATILKQYNFDNVLLCKFSRCFNTLGTCSASFILLFIAIDRFRKVCKPFGWQIKANIAKFLSVLSVVLGAFVAWPAIFIYGKKTIEIPQFNMTGTECSTADEMGDSALPFIYALGFGLLFITGIVVMSILYCFIGNEVKKHAQKMKLQASSSMMIPATSSVLSGRNSVLSCEIAPDMPKYEVAYKKNCTSCETNNKTLENRRRSKKFGQDNDDSSTDKKDKKDFELSYTQESNEKNDLSVEKTPQEISSNGVKRKLNHSESDDSGIKIKYDNECEEKETDIKNPKEGHQDNHVEDKTTDETTDRKAELSPTSSEEILPQQQNNIRKSISSIGGRISNVILRMTSITSGDRSQSSGTLKKTQFLKQARARKTAFLMFIITLAFIISFLPHLFLMIMRQIKDNFVDGLSDRNRAVYKFFLRSYFLNCAINPIIYSVCDSRFRSAIKEIFDHCFRRKSTDDVKNCA